jgi:ATP-dependent DNA helicase RecG
MKPSLQKLRKFFKLEAERGYDNHAVVGGLERMLEHWAAEARLEEIPEDLIQAVNTRIRDYGRLSPASRAEALEGIWRRIQRTIAAPEPPPFPDQETTSETSQKGAIIEDVSPEDEKESSIPVARIERPAPAPQEALGKPAALNASVTVLPGVGPRYAKTLGRLGISTLRDMLYHFPRRYDDYTQLKPINRLVYGDEVTVIGMVDHVTSRLIRGGQMQITEAIVSDGSGSLRVTWFNQPWLAKRLQGEAHIVLSGKIDQHLGRLTMNSPEWEALEQQQLNTNRITPVYPLTAQMTQRWLRRLMNQVVTYWAPRVQDPLPAQLRSSAHLVDLTDALLQAHFPDSWEKLKAAQERLEFDEIFLLQLGVLNQKRRWQDSAAQVFKTEPGWLDQQIKRLPFELTGAQQRAVKDIQGDLEAGRPMNRLLQGDVGSGKTAVAAMAIVMATHHGAQASYMAPTSILAEQHYKNLLKLMTKPSNPEVEEEHPAGDQNSVNTFEPPLQPDEIQLMMGSTPEANKRQIRQELAEGKIKLVIGTHALIEDPVVFQNLGLVIIDEQHRFGVEQRAALRQKGANPHLLVMTATPIPRSLALSVYGDLDLSIMDEMPPGRLPVNTHVLAPREIERGYTLIRNQIEQGRQAFIIYPLIDESEWSDAKAAVAERDRLQKDIFPDLKVGLLHGRMRSEEKESVMTQFREGSFPILVSTSVVEVGMDIPNASVMLIEGANRFGLAQLHQFRGRVGRSADKSYCLLVPDTPDEMENERLQVMVETNDGFILAERDLQQRGPGQFLGTRQSGYADLQFADLTDVHLIDKARRHALALFEMDPDLKLPEHQLLASALQHAWSGGRGDVS